MVGAEIKRLGIWKKFFNQEESIRASDSIEKWAEFMGMDLEEVGAGRLTSATYYACMQIRCNAVAKLPIKLMQETKKGSEKADLHPLYYLLKCRPNPFTSAHDFVWATEFQRLEYGNAFWAMDISQGQIRHIYLLDARNIEIIMDNTGILNHKNAVYYLYSDAKLGQVIYTSDSIVHFKNFAMNGLEGTSIKKYLGDIIENEQRANKIIKGKYKNGLQDPVIVEYTGDLNGAMQQSIKKKFADLGGVKNAGRVIPIPTDFKISQLETKLVNSQFFQLQGLTTRHIANAFEVKSFQLNDMEKSTYSNIEQQNKAFYSDTLQNVLASYEQEMDYKMLAAQERQRGYFFKFNADSILRSDLNSRSASYQIAISSGYMSIAEVREKEDLPYVEGTDELIIGNGASIPLKDLGRQYTEKGTGGGREGEEDQ